MKPSEDPLNSQAIVAARLDGHRLDHAAAELFPEFSRSRLQSWIKNGALRLNDEPAKPKDKVYADDRLSLSVRLEPEQAWLDQPIELDFAYRDDMIAVINKPAGLVTHPGAGNPSGTLANGLLHALPEQSTIPRAGIVHRLDKDTSGLLVVALNLSAHQSLVQQLQARSVSRQYLAVVHGRPPASGRIDKPIGRHRQNRQKMAVLEHGGKPAVTHFETLEVYDSLSLVQLRLETGRTHQIRVHMTDLGYPLLGDPVYGRKRSLSQVSDTELLDLLKAFPRQALHAEQLALDHPGTGERLQWQASLPDDMQAIVDGLRQSLR